MTTQTQTKNAVKKTAKVPARKVLKADNKAAQVATLCERFNTAKADEKNAKARKEAAELEIREMLGDNVAIEVNGVERIKLGYGSNSSIDRALLSEAYPEAYQACSRTTAYDFIKAV